MRRFLEKGKDYPSLFQAGEVLSEPPAKIIGRDANEIRKGLRNPEKANIVLLGEPGTGKAIMNSEWLPVADERGFIRMGDVKIGDRVFDENGHPTKVIGVYPQGKQESYRVHFADGSSVVCNDEHLWDVRTEEQKKNSEPFETKTLRELLDSGIYNETEGFKWYIPKAKAVVRDETDYDNRLIGSIEQRQKVLDSLLKGNRLYRSHSKESAEFVRTLATSLGMTAILSGDGTSHFVEVVIPEEDVAIVAVEKLNRKDEMTCILVEAESHLFQVTKSHIVTHNTAAVQAFAYDKDSVDHYLTLEINPEKIMGKGEDRDSALLVGFRNIVEEAGRYSREQNVIVVLFIDEFHKIAMFSPSLVEALKPILEKSALNNFRIIASTTFEEYNEWIASKNRALDQRFLRITLSELPEEVVLKILQGRAKQHGVEELLHPTILQDIYRESKRILLSNSQPRASIDILLSMIGETVKTETMKDGKLVRTFYTPQELGIASEYSLSRPLLKRIIQRTHSIDIDNKVNIHHVASELKSRLFNQDQAIDTVMRYLEMAAVGFSDPDRPKFSFLATGTTGTGKTELAKIVSETMRLPLRRFDMSRYSSEEDAGAFADDLFHAVWSTPNAYLLIDEVEKSSRKAMNILLQVLDDARLTDSANPDRVASFTGSIINLTTNLGSEVLHNMHKHKDETAEIDTELIYKALADSDVFETAVLGRIDAIVPFRPLPYSALEKIAISTLRNFIDIAETRKRPIMVSKDVIPYIVTDRTSMDTERGGARDVKRNIKNLVAQLIANHIAHAKEEVPIIVYIKGEPRFKFAHIVDPLNAEVALQPCYSVESTNQLLQSLGKKLNVPLVNKNLLLPNNVSLKEHAQAIVRVVQSGYNKLTTEVDGEEFTIVGVE